MESAQLVQVPEFPSFFVDSTPKVYQLVNGTLVEVEQIHERDYKTCRISNGFSTTRFYVHRLVALCFLGPCPKGMQVCHGPKGSKDNSPENLSYGTPQKNSDDKRRDGTMVEGEKAFHAKLTTENILEIRKRREQGEKIATLAKEFSTSRGNISLICSKRRWKHL